MGSKPPLGGVRSLAPAFRRGKRTPRIRARVAGGRKTFPKMPVDVKTVAGYRGLAPVALTVPPPEGGGWGFFAAYGGTDCLSSNLVVDSISR